MPGRTAIIIGAGPAGLTAAFELLTRTDIVPIVLEQSPYLGGISRTHVHNGNRMDIGGHRFFSKSDRVMSWWLDRMPLDPSASAAPVSYHGNQRMIAPRNNDASSDLERVMLLRPRKSRIYFLRKFFDYPIRLTTDTLQKLGAWRTTRIGFSYLRAALFPVRSPKNLEEFFINRFGRELYLTFFKSYTEKVWGVSCSEISAEWGEQRIKGLSIRRTIAHFLRQAFSKQSDIAQKNTETSLIEQFLYPKYGPGQMWEEVGCQIRAKGGQIHFGLAVNQVGIESDRVAWVGAKDASGEQRVFRGDFFFSTMAIKDLVRAIGDRAPNEVTQVSEGLQYRDFITVGLLVKKLRVHDPGGQVRQLIRDNWIYIQEPDVLAGRLQIFNNWSPALVSDPDTVWLGVEYFCYDTDELWKKADGAMAELAAEELDRIGIIDKSDVLDSTVLRVPKTYPAYFGAYARFDEVRRYLDSLLNLFPVGRNGMHKYNNQDHSMLTAMTAVDNIIAGRTDKSNLWQVNTEMEYHESKSAN